MNRNVDPSLRLGDPGRCDRCGVYWQPDADGLVTTLVGGHVCRDRVACEQRIALSDRLDRAIARGKL